MQIYDGRDDKKAFPTKHTAAVVSAGRVSCEEYDQMTIRKNGREDWSLYYCEAGRVHFEDGVLEPGQVWIYPPGVPQKYTMYCKDKTAYRYLHFTGSEMAALMESVGIIPSAAIDVKSSVIPGIFDNIQSCMAEDSILSELNAEYHTLYLLSQIARSSIRLPEIHLMKRVTDNMEHSFAVAYDASRYARMLKISVSRFDHLFKQCMGMSPYAYYIRLRMANACSLLEATDLKIKDIAERCGYQDAMYFTQAFKKEIGLTPSAYRREKRP